MNKWPTEDKGSSLKAHGAYRQESTENLNLGQPGYLIYLVGPLLESLDQMPLKPGGQTTRSTSLSL